MVRGLKSFIKNNISHAWKTINIEREIREWKIRNEGATPKIVIDLQGFYRALDNSQLDILCGNQKDSLNIIESVLERFIGLGVELVFFYGGFTKYNTKINILSERHEKFLQNLDFILEMIKNNKSPDDIIGNLKDNIYNNAGYVLAVVMLVNKYGDVYKSYFNDCERDISLYASKNNAVAVLSSDTDLIIVDGSWRFWNIHEFNISKFQILEIDKTKVREFFGLSVHQLPVLGVLTTNNIPGTLVYDFIKTLGHLKFQIQHVAKFISKHFLDTQLTNAKEIANILSNKNKAANALSRYIKENNEHIKGLLNFFANIADETDPSDDDDDELFKIVKQIHITHVFEFLNDLPSPIRISFFDLRQPEYASFPSAALQIFQRQMGIVLQDNGEKVERSIFCYDKASIIDKTVVPEYPTIMVPTLLELYKESKDETLRVSKFELLCWIVSDNLKYKIIENIKKPYLCCVVTLVFMVEKKFISTEEADLILFCLQQSIENVEQLKLLDYPAKLAERPFQLLFLYDKFYQFIAMSMNTVGLHEFLVYNQLNGVYFHRQYKPFIKDMSASSRDQLLISVNSYRVY